MPKTTPRGRITGIVWIPLLLAVFAAPPAAAQDPGGQTFEVEADASLRALLADAEDRLAAGDARGAWELLAPAESAHAGNPLYDYLLGVAALDSGRLSEAVFSLRRALAVAPGFSGARLELARAYFDSGEMDRARPLFQRTLDAGPPAPVREVIVRYLRAIDAAPAVPESRFLPYVGMFAGHDSNANGSTADEQFMGFTLNGNNVKAPSPFVESALGFDWYVPRSNRFGWQLGARASHRRNADAGFVDATIVNGHATAHWRRGDLFGHGGVYGYHGTRDGDSNESFAGAELALGTRVSERWDLGLTVQGGAQRYDDAIEILDVDRVLYSLALSRRAASGARFSIAAIGGEDRERLAGSPYGNRKIGARATWSMALGAAARVHMSAGSLTSDYDGRFFGVGREDRQVSAVMDLEFRDVLTPGLSVSPRVRYVDNDSEIALYDYKRIEIGIALRWTRQ